MPLELPCPECGTRHAELGFASAISMWAVRPDVHPANMDLRNIQAGSIAPDGKRMTQAGYILGMVYCLDLPGYFLLSSFWSLPSYFYQWA